MKDCVTCGNASCYYHGKTGYHGELCADGGNAKVLREAVVLALSLLDLKEGVPYKTVSQKDIDFMKAALAAPPRQCDVGTAEEQYSRMFRECYEWTCADCKSSDKDFRKCALSWAQKPYVEKKWGVV